METLIEDFNQLLIKINNLEDTLLDEFELARPIIAAVAQLPSREGTLIFDAMWYSYRFHGAGCTYMDQDKNCIDYDFRALTGSDINFSLWKLSRSLNSVSERLYSMDILVDAINKGLFTNILFLHPLAKHQYGVCSNYRWTLK